MENFHGFNKIKSSEIDKLQEAIQFLGIFTLLTLERLKPIFKI